MFYISLLLDYYIVIWAVWCCKIHCRLFKVVDIVVR